MDYFGMMRRVFTAGCIVALLLAAQSVNAEEKFGGIGVQVVPISTGELSVLHVVSGSPAERGGLRPGDVIVVVDELPMKGSDFDLVTRKYLWGRVGTSVSLTWLRPGVVGELNMDFKRVSITKGMKVQATPGVNISTPK